MTVFQSLSFVSFAVLRSAGRLLCTVPPVLASLLFFFYHDSIDDSLIPGDADLDCLVKVVSPG